VSANDGKSENGGTCPAVFALIELNADELKNMDTKPITIDDVIHIFNKLLDDRAVSEAEKSKQCPERAAEDFAKQEARKARLAKQAVKEKKASDRRWKKLDRMINKLGNRTGDIVEALFDGGIVRRFRALGYDFTTYAKRVSYNDKSLGIAGEFDMYLEAVDVALVVKVEVKPDRRDVDDHIARMEKYKRYMSAETRRRKNLRYVAAIAGAVFPDDVKEYAMQNGLYALVQSGEVARIAKTPEGVKARVW
jgi:hypothetical protein